jgi:hypothetical protein
MEAFQALFEQEREGADRISAEMMALQWWESPLTEAIDYLPVIGLNQWRTPDARSSKAGNQLLLAGNCCQYGYNNECK